jgi:TPR repeat protein
MKWNYREALKWYTKAAENGSIYAQSGLAFLYQHGLGVNIDYTKAIDLYTQAARMRNVKAQISLGCIFRKGEIVDKDLAKATEWYKRATKEGSQVTQNCLDLLDGISTNDGTTRLLEKESPKRYFKKGLCSRLRDDVDTITEPVKLNAFKKLASNAMKKDGNALLEIGLSYYDGNLFQQDKGTAFRWIRKAAKTGLTKAQCIIAEIYKNDDCVEQDYLKSSIWYTSAANQRDSKAQYHLGQLYYQGLGIRKDPLEASRQYTFAAEKKHKDAQCQLGFLREKGEGLRQDIRQAIKIYTDLTKLKHLEALHRLAKMYEIGNRVELNFQRALFLYEKAADLGHLNAQFRLGKLYSDRNNSVFSAENAFKYYKMAADQNHPEAKYRLAIMYLDGIGVKQDLIQAYSLFSESRDLCFEHAENIFQVPINYRKNFDIDYKKVADMFKLVCENNLSSLEYNLGYHYEHESIFHYNTTSYINTADVKQAKEWYLSASSKNNSKAQYRLGLIYDTEKVFYPGRLIIPNHYLDSRKNGNRDASYKLACMYVNKNRISGCFQKSFGFLVEALYKGPSEAADLLFELYKANQNKKQLTFKEILEELVESGNIIIQYKLGLFHIENGLSNCDSIQQGIKWLSKSSEGGYIEASYQLGILFEEGIGVKRSHAEAIKLYHIAADKGHEDALYRLARLYHGGNGTKQDLIKAFGLYTIAANYGHPLAELATKITNKLTWEHSMDELQKNSKDSALDYNDCLQMWEYVADIGNPNLQYQLGNAYEEMGSGSDLVNANKWYSKATEHSHGPSLFRLGRLFELGLGAKQDYKKAIELYDQSAMTGNNDALNAMGNIYQKGHGVESNVAKAFGYYKNAAENGDSKAQFTLGTIHENEETERRDILEAFKWFSISASQGNEEARSHLEYTYEKSDSDDLFNRKSLHCLLRFVKLERSTNQPERTFFGEVYYRLGCIYYYGCGIPINYEKAWGCFKKSCEIYDENKAAIFLNINPRHPARQRTTDYLKKLEMWESVTSHLKKEDIYELGLIYHRGVYEDANASESDKVAAIIGTNTHRAADYFRMVIDKRLPGI